MKRISKTLALILALVMIFTLAACGSDDTTPADTSKPAESGDPTVSRLSRQWSDSATAPRLSRMTPSTATLPLSAFCKLVSW